MTISPYPTLLSPLSVAHRRLRNRVIMGSMHTRMELAADPIERQCAFYAERARGGVAMIISGGYAPNVEGMLEPHAPRLDTLEQTRMLRPIVDAVHREGSLFLLQILHAGRYATHDRLVAPSAIAAPINPRVPRSLSVADIERTIEDYVRCAELAVKAGCDGVEVMGSEGYLLNQFTAPRTNQRADAWGGSLDNRLRLPLEVVRRMRARLPRDCIVMFRISALDLVQGGLTGDEIALQASAIAAAGADILSTGIGWHEARIPTIAYMVPRAAWRFALKHIKQAVAIPVVASNRINMPELAEDILACGEADLVSLARPLLADPAFVRKAEQGRAQTINTCIACNQACLDYIFSARVATCLVNPRACREIELPFTPTTAPKRIAVIGAGPAGLAFATTAQARGHRVTLFEADTMIGGQINLALRVPGKQEFAEMLRYYRTQLAEHGVEMRLGVRASARTLVGEHYDHVVVATGVRPRIPKIEGIDHPSVATYGDILAGRVVAGPEVVIIGSGGIGHDVAVFLTDPHAGTHAQAFLARWGVDPEAATEGGLIHPARTAPLPRVVMLQRRASRPGERLGVSTGWILRLELRKAAVTTLTGCTYERIDDRGMHIRVEGKARVLPAATIIVCSGQEPANDISAELVAAGLAHDIIGGARDAAEIDAARAIDEGYRLALRC